MDSQEEILLSQTPSSVKGDSEAGGAAESWTSMAEFRASLGMPMLTSNPVLDMREEERY